MKNSMVKINGISVRNNNTIRRNHGVRIDRTIEMPGVVRVICGTCEEGDLPMLAACAREENKRAGMDMAVGYFVSDRPLSDEEAALLAMQHGHAGLIQKRFLGNRENVRTIENRNMCFIEE